MTDPLTPSVILADVRFTLIPFLAGVVGAIIGAFYVPSPRLQSMVQHFAAGVVFAAVAGEVLPDVHEQAPIPVIIGFAVGTAAMLAIREGVKTMKTGTSALPLVIAVGVDLVIDGFLLGIGFTAGMTQGVLLAVALTIEVLFVGLATATELHKSGTPRRPSIVTVSALAVLVPVSTFVGLLVISRFPPVAVAGLLAFGAAALLYLVTEELLVEAHEVPETPITAATFFSGFLLLFVIEMLAG